MSCFCPCPILGKGLYRRLCLCCKKNAMATTFLKDQNTRKWMMQVLIVLLMFSLAAWVAWLFYNYHVNHKHKEMTTQTATIHSTFLKHQL
jgi:ABC-type amino acid transport system permease subunit